METSHTTEVKSFMTAYKDVRTYNGVNGAWCNQNARLLDDVLRREQWWSGLVMRDW